MPRWSGWSGWSVKIRAAFVVVLVAAATVLGYAVWWRGSEQPAKLGAAGSMVVASAGTPVTSRRGPVTGMPSSTGSASRPPASTGAGMPSTMGATGPASTGAESSGPLTSVTPMAKTHALPAVVVLPWTRWKVQAATVCRTERLSDWADQLAHGSSASVADPVSKRYAVRKLGVGSGSFYSIMSGLGVSGAAADQRRRSDLLIAAKGVADTARATTSTAPTAATSRAWQRVANALAADSIGC